jgi:hypothetical protein
MVLTYKVLGQGQLPAATAALVTVPAGHQYIIKQVRLVNPTGGTDRTVALYVNGSAAANQIFPTTNLVAGTLLDDVGTITLNAAETLQGVAAAATEITYTIFGLDITV